MPYCANSRKINADILVELCGGNKFDALKRCRFYSGITINVSVKTLEGILCDEFLGLGYSDTQISEMLEINKERVENRRRKLYDKKRANTRNNKTIKR